MQHSTLARSLLLVLLVIGASGCDLFTTSGTRMQRARIQMQSGKYAQAMRELKKVLDELPDDPAARLQMSELLLQVGDLDAAQKEMERAVAAHAADAQVYPLRYRLLESQRRYAEMLRMLDNDRLSSGMEREILRSHAYAGLGRYDEAASALAAAEAVAADDPRALLQHARLAAVRGDMEQALAFADRITQPDDVRARALALRAGILLNQGEHAKARDLFGQARELGKKSLSVPEQVVIWISLADAQLALRDIDGANASVAAIASWTPDSLYVHYLRGRIALLKNEYSVAVTECQRALQVDPAHVPSQLMLAAANLGKGSVEQAQGALEALLSRDPGNLAAGKMLAQVYLLKKRPEEARRVLAGLSDRARDDPQVNWLMGEALTGSGDNAAGLEYLERSSAANPGDYERRVVLAAAQLAAGNRDAALNNLRSLPPGSSQTGRAQQLLLATIISGKSPAEARVEIDRLVAPLDTDPQLLSTAGAYLLSAGDMQRASELLQRASERDPKAIPPRMALAIIAARRSDFATAEARLQQIVSMDPTYEPAYMALAQLALRRGERPVARQWLEKAVGVSPEAVQARLGLARLAFADSDPARGRDLIGQALNVAKNHAGVLNAAGEVLAQVGLYEEALVKFTAASAAGLPEGALNAARVHLELGRKELARQNLEGALRLRPGWPAAQQVLVQLDVGEGYVDRAVARARVAAQQSSDPAAVPEVEGDVRMLAKQFVPATVAYEKAWRARPSARLAWKLFKAQTGAGKKPAEDEVVSWLRHASATPATREMLAQYYYQTGRAGEAVAEYQRLTKADGPQDAALLNNLAWLYQEIGDKRAEETARHAYQLAPKLAAVADTYGWVLLQNGRVPEGLKALLEAHGASPNDANIAYHLAAAYDRSGNKTRAVELLDGLLASSAAFASRGQAETLRASLGTPVKANQ